MGNKSNADETFEPASQLPLGKALQSGNVVASDLHFIWSCSCFCHVVILRIQVYLPFLHIISLTNVYLEAFLPDEDTLLFNFASTALSRPNSSFFKRKKFHTVYTQEQSLTLSRFNSAKFSVIGHIKVCYSFYVCCALFTTH